MEIEEDVTTKETSILTKSTFFSAIYLNLEKQIIKLQDNVIVSEVRDKSEKELMIQKQVRRCLLT